MVSVIRVHQAGVRRSATLRLSAAMVRATEWSPGSPLPDPTLSLIYSHPGAWRAGLFVCLPRGVVSRFAALWAGSLSQPRMSLVGSNGVVSIPPTGGSGQSRPGFGSDRGHPLLPDRRLRCRAVVSWWVSAFPSACPCCHGLAVVSGRLPSPSVRSVETPSTRPIASMVKGNLGSQ
jgi:hypothetical protein